jgi:beta-glucanase (GH16 family)
MRQSEFMKVTLLLCGLALGGRAVAQSNGWTLVWADEFTQADGSPPNSAKWANDIGAGGWGNNERQYYSTTNASITNNMLVIEARRTINGSTTNYSSARLKTQGKASWAYGRMEARLKLPRGQGIWPAFWTLGTNITTPGNGWPNCGEIDILENIGREPTIVHGTVHGPGYSGGNAIGGPYSLPGNAVFADDFHVYAVEWRTNQIKWFVDDAHYFTVTPASVPGDWVFNAPQFLILNVAVGGNWPGYPDATTVFPQRLLVDYVRVYSISNVPVPPPTNSGVLLNGSFESGLLAPWIGKGFGNANPSGGVVVSTNGLVWDPNLNANNNQGIRNPAFGAYACKLYGNFDGGPNHPGFYQDVAAVPGSLWTATVKARTQNTDYIRHDNEAVVEVSFLDGIDNVLAKYASQVFTTNLPINTWIDLDVTNRLLPTVGTTNRLQAPAGTVKARFEVTYSQTLYEVGSIYFDEAKLQEIVFAPPTLAASLVGPGTIQLSFATQPDVNYRIVYKNALSDPAWNPLETLAGDGTVKSVIYPTTGLLRFFAVQLL